MATMTTTVVETAVEMNASTLRSVEGARFHGDQEMPPEMKGEIDAKIVDPPADLRERRLKFAANKERPAKIINDNFLKTAKKQPTNVPRPIWAMRQAGRYLPEFKMVRSLNSFFEVCETPKLAAEVTIQPYNRFPDLDALVIFSDILVIPVAMGIPCQMIPGKGPTFDFELELSRVGELNLKPDIEKTLGYVFDAIHWTYLRMEQKVPIIGFCGAPWSLLAYMIEGGGSKTWNKAKKWIYTEPEVSKKLLTALRDICIEYLIKQYDAGASILQIFDSNAGELPPHIYEEFCLDDLKFMATAIRKQRPDAVITIFAKDALLEPFNDSDYDVVGVSWKQSPEYARRACPSKVLQGNLDPVALFGTPENIEKAAHDMLRKFGDHPHIANLGHGMLPEHTPEALRAYIKAVKNFKKP